MTPRTRPGPLRRAVLVPVVVLLGAGAALSACGGSQEAGPTTTLAGPAEEGRQVFQAQGCASCHSVDGEDGVGPALDGLAGSEVELTDGTTVTADEAYLRESILNPDAEVVKGFRPIMPQRDLSDADVTALIAYLEAIGSDADAGGSSGSGG